MYIIILFTCTYMYMYVQYRSDARYKANTLKTLPSRVNAVNAVNAFVSLYKPI